MSNNTLRVIGKLLHCGEKTYRCTIGKNGMSADKKEGDGCTPVGIFPLRECWYRLDRMEAPKTRLPLKILRPEDGWCDEPSHAKYNRHVTLPFDSSHEILFRDDEVYDVIVPLGYNDGPIVPGKGSAIFMHIAHEDYRGTEGCIALSKADLLEILRQCDTNTVIEVPGA